MRPRTQKILWALYPWVAFCSGVLIIETSPPLTDANRGPVGFVFGAGFMILVYLAYLMIKDIERQQRIRQQSSRDWIDSTPLFRRDDMPMYYAEEESEEERVKKVK